MSALATLPIPDRVRRRHRRRLPLTVSAWAERYRMITEGPLVAEGIRAVPWSNAVFPPGVAIMDAAARFRRVIMLAAPQASGKTALAVNVLLKGLHWDNLDGMYVHANAARAESQYGKKIGPAIAAEENLAELIPASRDEIGTKEDHKFTNGRSMFVTGSESEGDLSGVTAPLLFFDDVHAMPDRLGTHGHPIEFAEHRAGAFPPEDRVTLVAGQASDDHAWLWKALLASTFYVLYLPCPGCGTYQILDFDRFVFDDASPESAAKDCWMRCAKARCKHEIRHDELPDMLAEYAWVSTPPDVNPVLDPAGRSGLKSLKGERVYPESARPTQDAGFWWPAFTWSLVPWTSHAANWVSARGNPDSVRTFRQQVRVIPWIEPKADEDALEPADIKAHALKGHRWKSIPALSGDDKNSAAGSKIIVTADVQAGYIWYLVLAWLVETGLCSLVECGRYGSRTTTEEFEARTERQTVWKSRVRRALDQLWTKEAEGWPVVNEAGEVLATRSADLVLVDCSFLRETVQTTCKLHNGGKWLGKWRAVEGSQCKARGKVPIWPGNTRATVEKKTRRRYWESNTNRAKLHVRDILAVPPGGPGSLVLPADMPAYLRDKFASHLCAEEWQPDKGTWKQTSGENHLLDAMALQIAGAIAMDVTLSFLESKKPPSQTRQRPRPRLMTPDGRPFLVTER